VELQFRVAAGETLPLRQHDVTLNGHAVEARLYAEDPEKGFLPSTGRLWALQFGGGEGIRVDAGVAAGGEVSPFYDPMIAKIIAHGPTREAALERLSDALRRTVVAGPRTNLAFLAALSNADEFRAGRFDTGFIDRNLTALGAVPQPCDSAAAAAGAARLLAREAEQAAGAHADDAPSSPWDIADAFQLSGPRRLALPIRVDGERAIAHAIYAGGAGAPRVSVDGVDAAADALAIDAPDAVYVLHRGRQTVVKRADAAIDVEHLDGDGVVRAPMHGKVLAVLVEAGTTVTKGQRLAVIEAMKMEHSLVAPVDGRVREIAVEAGSQIAEGATVMMIEPEQGQ
jgi:3-methylcrotonyl-CoA carboxylase alpha subunit